MAMICERIERIERRPRTFERKVGILIPAHNEATHLARLLTLCRAVRPAVVVVVDDGSTDDTPIILERIADTLSPSLPLVVIRNEACLGKQGAVRRGLRELAGWDVEAVALVDGDLQHDPRELPALALLLGDCDLVIGARSAERMPVQRRLSNWLVNRGFEWIGGVDFVDVQSGLRIYRKLLVDVLADRLPPAGGFALEHESLTLLARYGRDNRIRIRVRAAPISCAYGLSESGIGPGEVIDLAMATVRQAVRLRRVLRLRAAC